MKTFPIFVCGLYLLRHFCDVTNKACYYVICIEYVESLAVYSVYQRNKIILTLTLTLVFLTLLTGLLKLRIFAIILEGMGRFLKFCTKMLIFINANHICKVHIVFTHGQLQIARNCDSEHIQNTFIFCL